MKQSKHLINTFMNTNPSSSDAPDFTIEAKENKRRSTNLGMRFLENFTKIKL